MAHKESGELQSGSSYALGEYSFRIERTSVPGSSNDKFEAICTKDGKNARKSIQLPSSIQMPGWYVEANETTADVYIIVEGGSINAILSVADGEWLGRSEQQAEGYRCSATPGIALATQGSVIYLTRYGDGVYRAGNTSGRLGLLTSVTGHSTAGYWGFDSYTTTFGYISPVNYKDGIPFSTINPEGKSIDEIDISGTKLVGRFAIELEDAGGVGPESDWTDPGDYDDDWEPDEPTHTLNIEIDGALSGRHNDPLNDTSYSYVPADKATVKDYGCGGDGGNGGGGGAGASSIVVYKFATNKADGKEITVKPKRHGYGSGGGKGGKGGDGCILIYY